MHLSHRQQFLQYLAQTSPSPLLLEISKAQGHYLYGPEGKKYLDFISGISVCNLGHSHPSIVKAVQDQAASFMHTMVYGELVLAPQVALAQKLTSLLPQSLNTCYFVNSGSEAVEGAMKLAKRVTARNGFIAQKQAYHGSTQGALSLMSDEYFTSAFRPLLPNVQYITQNHLPDVDRITEDIAAVIIEPVQAEKGAIPCGLAYLKAVREKCTETGSLLIFDEIQTGMGRTGSLFAFESFGVVPDVLLLGKAFGGGMPLGAFIADHSFIQSLSENPVLGHITTFGGHPVSCVASLAALSITVEQLSSFDIAAKEVFIRNKAAELGLGEITGKGLLLALDLGSAENCKKVIDLCLIEGLFTDWFLFAPEKLRIAPPLSISYQELTEALEIIAKAIKT
jgi:acetylornithine/N-succinyldiaminopimelate aminotransferase